MYLVPVASANSSAAMWLVVPTPELAMANLPSRPAATKSASVLTGDAGFTRKTVAADWMWLIGVKAVCQS